MEQAIQKVALADTRTYKRLSSGLKTWTDMEGFEALLKLSHNAFRYIDNESDVSNIENEFNICEGNKVRNEHGGICDYKCICGKKHIKHINIFNWDNQEHDFCVIIGSKCIEHLGMYEGLCEEYPELSVRVNQWVNVIKEEVKKLTNKQCVCCKRYAVRKNYKYKDEKKNYWCKKCVYGDFVKCVKCLRLRKYGFSQYYNKPYYECVECYYS
jgi:hypothetical protein